MKAGIQKSSEKTPTLEVGDRISVEINGEIKFGKVVKLESGTTVKAWKIEWENDQN